MEDTPSIEQRIRAAMALAGLDEDALSERISTKGYSARTIQRILDPTDKKRAARDPDLHLIEKACRVSPVFWTVDFAQLDSPRLRDEVSVVKQQIADLQAGALKVARAIEELRRKGLPDAPTGDDPR